MLILAKGSALNTLDKLAVAINDYLNLGDHPRKKLNFRDFWTTKHFFAIKRAAQRA